MVGTRRLILQSGITANTPQLSGLLLLTCWRRRGSWRKREAMPNLFTPLLVMIVSFVIGWVLADLIQTIITVSLLALR